MPLRLPRGRARRRRRAAGLLRRLGPWLLAPALLVDPAAALVIDFDGAGTPSLSDLADAPPPPGVAFGPALVLSEADLAAATALPTAGFATSGERGVLNALAPALQVDFSVPVLRAEIDVVGLPHVSGEGDHTVLLQAWRGDVLVALDFSDAGRIGDSGRHEDHLRVEGDRIDRILLQAADRVPCELGLCFETIDLGSTFFADTLVLEPVPEPATALLVALGGVGLAAARRRAAGR